MDRSARVPDDEGMTENTLTEGNRVRHKNSKREGVVLAVWSDGYVEIRYDDNILGRYDAATGARNNEGAQARDLERLS